VKRRFPFTGAAAERLAAAAAWPAWPGDEPALGNAQFNWAMTELYEKGLLLLAMAAIDPLGAINPAAWDQLLGELLGRLRGGTQPRHHNRRSPVISMPLARYLTIRLVECCPDMARLQRVAQLVRLVLGSDDIGKREIGKPGAIMHAARYYYHYKRRGIAVGIREIAKHAGVSHGLAARWVASWKKTGSSESPM
jgi:hypothetical protein